MLYVDFAMGDVFGEAGYHSYDLCEEGYNVDDPRILLDLYSVYLGVE